jgi:hypothetical protein
MNKIIANLSRVSIASGGFLLVATVIMMPRINVVHVHAALKTACGIYTSPTSVAYNPSLCTGGTSCTLNLTGSASAGDYAYCE